MTPVLAITFNCLTWETNLYTSVWKAHGQIDWKMYWGLWICFFALGIKDWMMYWICFVLAGWLLVFFHFILSHSISSHFISFRYISYIPYLLPCPFRRWNGSILECGSVAKEIRERIKEEGERWGRIKKQTGEYEWRISWLAVFHHWGHQYFGDSAG